MTTLADRIDTQRKAATLEDLIQLDHRIVETEKLVKTLKIERAAMFEQLQQQRIDAERAARSPQGEDEGCDGDIDDRGSEQGGGRFDAQD